MKNVFILDSSALLAFLSNEEGADIVSEHIKNSSANEIELFVHSINCLEIFYKIYKRKGKKKSFEVLNAIQKLPIIIVKELSVNILKIAGEIKANNNLSLADSITVGLTKSIDGILLTSDHHELGPIQKQRIIKIKWIR